MNLKQKILERLNQGICPLIDAKARWKKYPPHMSALLRQLEPLHLIAVTRTFVYVDGLPIETDKGLDATFESAVVATEELFGKTEEVNSIAFNCELKKHENNMFSIRFFQGPIWYLIPCVFQGNIFKQLQQYGRIFNMKFPPCFKLALQRFAYIPNSDHFIAPKTTRDNSYQGIREKSLMGVAVVDGKPEITIPVSSVFFVNPKPENVRLFGDLCFLTQATESWKVDKSIIPHMRDYYDASARPEDSAETLAKLLKQCVGWKSFKRYGNIEILLDRQSGLSLKLWREILNALNR